MNDEVKNDILVGYHNHKYPDGHSEVHTYELICTDLRGRIATSLAGAVMGSTAIIEAMASQAEGEAPAHLSPRKIASFACDVARELIHQYIERGWAMQMPPPAVSVTVSATVPTVESP